MARAPICSYGDGEPVWCAIEVDGKLHWLCKHHYRVLLNKLEEMAESGSEASLDSLVIKTVKGGAKIRVENRV
ncbi:MAG: hypothetical protein QXH70_01495 [Thermofilaceae archaeon]